MKKRIAVCISGEMRYFNDPAVVDGYNKFIAPHNPDVFISTWDHIGKSMNHGYTNPSELKTTHLTIKSDISAAYNDVKLLKIDNYNNWINNIKPDYRHVIHDPHYNPQTVNSCAQLYKIADSINLKTSYEKINGFVYDIVVRIRPDNLFVKDFNFTIDNNTIYNMNFGVAYYPNRIYDILFYGDSLSMNSVAQSYNNFISLIQNSFNNGLCKRDACRLLYLQAVTSKLDIKTIETRLCDVYRGQGYENYYELIKSWGGI